MKKTLKSVLAVFLAVVCLTGCGTSSAAGGEKTARGTGKGIGGDVVVEVTATDSQIVSIEVVEQNETDGIGSVAVEQLPSQMVEANSIKVDGITTATVTSNAIKDGVRAALESMGYDVSVFEKEVSAENVEKTDVTLDYDVVVVGAGGAGLTAASRIAQEGKSVVVLEMMPLIGGNSVKASGGMNAAGTKYQEDAAAAAEGDEAEKIKASTVEAYIEDTMNGGHQINDKELVRTMAENSSDAIDWLTEIGAPLPKIAATGGTVHSYLHEPEDGSAVGGYLVEKLSAYVDKMGVEVMVNTEATAIINDNGKAAGVLATSPEHNYTINAKAVVLTTGGFGANFDMMASYNPALANAVTTNAAGAIGEGIKMAEEMGAATVDMEYIQLHPTVYQEDGTLVSERLRSNGAILVNSNGERFTNDLSTRDAVSNAELEQDGAFSYIVFDSKYVEEKLYQKYIKGGLTVSSDTLEGLAAEMGLEGDAVTNFTETVSKWNKACETGEDEFGRNNGLITLDAAPYYAIKIAPGIHHTMGGIKINTEAEVLDTDGNVIPGLYAAGETTGGVHGGNRIGGNAVCDFVVFGRIAGANAAAFAE